VWRWKNISFSAKCFGDVPALHDSKDNQKLQYPFPYGDSWDGNRQADEKNPNQGILILKWYLCPFGD
jgi:hypothetical protein